MTELEHVRIFTIPASAISACPTRIIHPAHYRKDGTCLHILKEREPVIFTSDVLDDGPREFYSGQKAVILGEAEQPAGDVANRGVRYIIEFGSGNRLDVAMNEVRPDDDARQQVAGDAP
jgi:hypothetical protein